MSLSEFETAQVAGSALGGIGPAAPCVAALQAVAERAENALSSSWRVAVGRFRALYNDVFIVSKMSIQAQPKHMDGLRCGGKFATPFQQPCTKKPS